MKKRKDNEVLNFIAMVFAGLAVVALIGVVLIALWFGFNYYMRLVEGKPFSTEVSEADIESVITFTGERDEATIEEIKEEMAYLPEALVAQFIYDGGVIIVEDRPLKLIGDVNNSIGFDENGEVIKADASDEDSVLGACGTKNGEVIIYLVKGHTDTACHEFGHYFSRYATDSVIREAYNFNWAMTSLDKASICDELLGNCDYFDDEEEYFAECFRQYVKGDITEEKYAATVSFFEDAVKTLD